MEAIWGTLFVVPQPDCWAKLRWKQQALGAGKANRSPTHSTAASLSCSSAWACRNSSRAASCAAWHSPGRRAELRALNHVREKKHLHMAVGQNHWYHFGVGAPAVLVYFSGDWDVHWGYGILTHGHMIASCKAISQALTLTLCCSRLHFPCRWSNTGGEFSFQRTSQAFLPWRTP